MGNKSTNSFSWYIVFPQSFSGGNLNINFQTHYEFWAITQTRWIIKEGLLLRWVLHGSITISILRSSWCTIRFTANAMAIHYFKSQANLIWLFLNLWVAADLKMMYYPSLTIPQMQSLPWIKRYKGILIMKFLVLNPINSISKIIVLVIELP